MHSSDQTRSFAEEPGASLKQGLADDRMGLCLLVVMTAWAAVLRICFLSQPMRYDESVTFLSFARQPLWYGLSSYGGPNNHVFHTLLVHISCRLLGDAPCAIRLPAFLAGVLMVPAAYLAARILYTDKLAALWAAGLVASSSPLIEYSTNARGYTLLCLIFLLLLALAGHLLKGMTSAGLLPFAVLSAMGFYTIPIMLYPFALLVVWILLSLWRQGPAPARRAFLGGLCRALILAALLTLLLYVPVFSEYGVKALFCNQFVRPHAWSYCLSHLPASVLSTWSAWNRDIPVWMSALLAGAFLIALVLHGKLGRHRVPVVLAAVIGIPPIVLLQRVVPFERVWFFLLPLYLIVASAGLSHVLTRLSAARIPRFPYLAAALALCLALWLGSRVLRAQSVFYCFPDAEPIVLFLKDRLAPGDAVVVLCPSDAPLQYYMRRRQLPPEVLAGGRGPVRRVFVIVNHLENQTLHGVLKEAECPADPARAKLVKKYESATLYELPLDAPH